MLKDEQVSKRVQNYMEMLPDILQELVPEISTLKDGSVLIFVNNKGGQLKSQILFLKKKCVNITWR